MKLLLLTHVFPPRRGGSGRWFWELYRRLSDIDVHVVAGTTDGSDAFDREAPFPITRLPLDFTDWGLLNWRAALQYTRTFLALRRLVSRIGPDAIQCGKCLPEGLVGLMLARWFEIPLHCYVHGEELTLARTSRELGRLSSRVLRSADIVVANSEHTRRLLVGDWDVPESRIVVMHPGVDTKRFVPAPQNPATRERLGWTNRRVVLTVGALQKRKGQDMMIRALPAIRERCPDVLYAIVGEGWERHYLETVVADAHVEAHVQFLGMPRDAELVELYQQCDVFALPNRRVEWDLEGFGIVLLEAQACGRPVIAGNSGGAPETVDRSRTGEIVDCETPEKLAEITACLLEDTSRRAAMGASARQWTVEHFDWAPLSREATALFRGDHRTASH